MGLLNLVRISVGEVGIKPGTLKMLTTDDLATVTTAGYLNGIGNQLTALDIAPSDVIECMYGYNTITDAGTFTLLAVSISNGVITLAAGAGSEPLPSAQIFVGNASNIAQARAMTGDIAITNTGVTSIAPGVIVNADINAAAAIAYSKLATLATGSILAGNGGVPTATALSGDATIGATGVLTIAANAITTAKILNANVTLAKLASGITPSHVIKFDNQLTTVGGSATEAFTVTGAVGATDHAYTQMVNNGTSNVTILEAVVTDNTLTITFSADPGNDTVFNYQLTRPAA
ncbi:MAG TPA: hypothetical protein VJ279_08410 [Hanamia sp.]|jgi:hypothetical protein|nr:hypothetical protein [Hanamia sp.]